MAKKTLSHYYQRYNFLINAADSDFPNMTTHSEFEGARYPK